MRETMQIDFNAMEKKWQKKRTSEQIYKVSEDPNKEKFYVLDMFPYPSGAGLHVGHPKGYIATDTLARKKMLEGFSVLHPMGFDTFGLGTEQYAIDHKMKPQVVAEQNIENFKRQLASMGFSYDRERSFSTADPDYYKRTQRVFLQLYNHYYDEEKKQARPISEYQGDNPDEVRLAYIDYKPINRCPHCKTGLANEDLEDGKCERCGSEVEQRPMRQRVLRITKYADRLLEGLDELNWDESMKELERNRIGKSTGTEFKMVVAANNPSGSSSHLSRSTAGRQNNEIPIFLPPARGVAEGGGAMLSFSVFTTRIDTVFGMTFVVMAPEHELVDQITTDEYREAVEAYKQQAKYKTQLERTELQKEKTGQFTGAYAINPFNGEAVPIFIGDYVLANYGTGVVMAVPAHDERDFDFAKKYDIPIVQSIMPIEGTPNEKAEHRETINAIVQRKSDGKFLFVKWKKFGWIAPVVGGIDEGEQLLESAEREVLEETGYKTKALKTVGRVEESNFFAENKNTWRQKITHNVVLELIDEIPLPISEEEKDIQEPVWLTYEEALEQITHKDNLTGLKAFVEGETAFCEKGRVFNSGAFSGLTSDEAIKAMQQRLADHELGGEKSNYKIQDWVFSRQRYWGEPFPVVFCEHCGEELYTDNTDVVQYDDIQLADATNKPENVLRIVLHNTKNNTYLLYFPKDEEGAEFPSLSFEENNAQLFTLATTQLKQYGFEHTTYKRMLGNAIHLLLTKHHYVFGIAYTTDETPFQEKEDEYGVFKRVQQDEVKKILNSDTSSILRTRYNTYKINPLPESDLPLLLPDVEQYEPTGREEGPLDDVERRMETPCPVCGNPAKRESNTMPGRAGSSWYRLRYMDPKNEKALVSKKNEQYRGNVDVYVGGAEHVTRHMIYARFWQKFLFDIGVVTKQEPFQKYEKVGLIMAEDGRKMSKRRGNVVNPDDVIVEYGADAFRVYEMFMGPFNQFVNWNTNGLKGVKKFLDKVIALWEKIDNTPFPKGGRSEATGDFVDINGKEIPPTPLYERGNTPKEIETLLHQTIKKTTEDIDAFRFNTTISQFMILVNKLSELDKVNKEVFQTFIILLAPFAPHLAEEFRSLLGNEFSIFTKATRPKRDKTKLTSDTVQLAIQFNGRVRGTIEVSPTASQEEVLALIKQNDKLNTYLHNGEVKKIIYVPGKIMNIVLS